MAFAVSLAAHGLAFLAVFTPPPPSGGRDRETAFVVELVSQAQAAPEPPPPEPGPVSEPEPVPEPEPEPEPAPPPSPDGALKPVSAPPPPPPHRPSSVPKPVPAQAVRPSPAPVQAVSVAVLDRARGEAARLAARDAELRRYAKLVWKHVLRHKPASGRAPGTVTMRFAISADGKLVRSAIVGSSGVPALDRLALEVLRRAQPFPPPPATAGVPVAFNLPFEFR